MPLVIDYNIQPQKGASSEYAGARTESLFFVGKLEGRAGEIYTSPKAVHARNCWEYVPGWTKCLNFQSNKYQAGKALNPKWLFARKITYASWRSILYPYDEGEHCRKLSWPKMGSKRAGSHFGVAAYSLMRYLYLLTRKICLWKCLCTIEWWQNWQASWNAGLRESGHRRDQQGFHSSNTAKHNNKPGEAHAPWTISIGWPLQSIHN